MYIMKTLTYCLDILKIKEDTEIAIGIAAARKAPNALTFCTNDSLTKNCSVSGTL